MNQSLHKSDVIFAYKDASLHFNKTASIAITSMFLLLGSIVAYKLLKG